MSRYTFKLPDLGEGTVEAEIIEWHVAVGDSIEEDAPLVDMMTDKANVEIPSPVTGKVVSRHGEPGDMVPVGTELVVIETGAGAAQTKASAPAPTSAKVTKLPTAATAPTKAAARAGGKSSKRPLTSPAVRMRARKAGIDLAEVPGSGPKGRISKEDLERYIENPNGRAEARRAAAGRRTGADEVKVIGVRRVIAQRLTEAKRTIPHFSYVEEVDVTELEALRLDLNRRHEKSGISLTYLPFVCIALVRALEQFPQCNATYDAERNVIVRHHPVHVGIATHTPDGLKVPVVPHAEARDVWDFAREIQRVSGATRDGSATREMLTGSTITVTSLGRLGGIASTPVINMPEVAIIGVNKSVERPVVRSGAVVIRRLMNLSSSFDHRFVDGYDAAGLIQAVKERLEQPALLFVPAP
jgi:2-oxoisovalerate dehydrogenase E2 component (dihydrolipoyl transacylase)